MNRRYAFLLAAFFMILNSADAADNCQYPDEVDMPDGSTATEEEMLAAKKRVEDYIADMEAYRTCLEEELTTLGESMTEEQRKLNFQRDNAAVDAMYRVSNAFNEQIAAYKSAQR